MGSTPLYSHLALEVTCPKCSKQGVRRLSEVIAQNGLTCGICHYEFPLASDDWNFLGNEMIDQGRKIKTNHAIKRE